MDTATINGTFRPKRFVSRAMRYEHLSPCVGGVKRHLAFDDEGDANIHHRCGPQCDTWDLWDDLDFVPDVTVEWENVSEVLCYNEGEENSVQHPNSPTDFSFGFGTPVQSGVGFGSSSSLFGDRISSFPVRNSIGNTVTEDYVYPSDWSEDSVFLPPRENRVNTTVTLAEGEKNRTFGITSAEVGADLTGAAKSGDSLDIGDASMSWDYPSICSPEHVSLREQPLCSTPLPPKNTEQEELADEISSVSLSSWLMWAPFACLAIAGAGYCAVKFCR